MSGFGTVYKKEVRENLRDRRSLFNSVLLGPILFPVLFIGLAYFAGSKQQERAEKLKRAWVRCRDIRRIRSNVHSGHGWVC